MQVFILSNPFDIEELGTLPDFGECDTDNRVIRLRLNQSHDQMIDTIFHEITHAIWELTATAETDGEEKIALRLGLGLGSIYRDPRNAEFIEHLNSFRPKEAKEKKSKKDSE